MRPDTPGNSPPPPPQPVPPFAPPEQYPYAPPPSRGGLPVWVWILGGCAVFGVFGVVILAAILFPVFSAARESARTVSCMSNEKQMALGVMMYVQDYDERLPPTAAWMDLIDPYVKNQYVYHCPELSSAAAGAYGYALDSRLSEVELRTIKSPNATLMLFDSTATERSASDPGRSLPDPGRHRRGGEHGNNQAFMDGHVRFVAGSQPSTTGF